MYDFQILYIYAVFLSLVLAVWLFYQMRQNSKLRALTQIQERCTNKQLLMVLVAITILSIVAVTIENVERRRRREADTRAEEALWEEE